MNIKYELHAIRNAEGKGGIRKFVRLFTDSPADGKTMGQTIQASCTLTESDIQATLVAIGRQMASELKHGRRVHIPEVGYFSLSAGIDNKHINGETATQTDRIRVRNIRFRPEASLLNSIRRDVRFEKAAFTSQSKTYTADELWRGVKDFLGHNRCITRRDMEREFGLRESTARKWLKKFVSDGRMSKEGAHNSPVYMLA